MTDGWGRRQELTRRSVLEAAGELIAEGGADHLTMRRLAERAGVAVATLYNQFGDRSGLLVAFVSNGLDQLEGALDAKPDAGPIDATRALFETLDEILSTTPDVWRAVFTSLGLGLGANLAGMGALGDRLTDYISADLGKAAADELFIVEVDAEALAFHIFITRINRIEKWARGLLDWDEYRASSKLGLELILSSVLIEELRLDALRRSGVSSAH